MLLSWIHALFLENIFLKIAYVVAYLSDPKYDARSILNDVIKTDN